MGGRKRLSLVILAAVLLSAVRWWEGGAGSASPDVLPAPSFAPRWSFQTGSSLQARPLVLGGMVYVGSNEGTLYGLRVSDGKPVWRFSPVSPLRAAPAGDDRNVFLGAYDGTLYALDSRTGWLKWQFSTPSWIRAPPLVVGNSVYVASYSGILYALDRETGALRWYYSVGDDFIGSAPVADRVSGLLFVQTANGVIHALDLYAGEQKWRRRLPGVTEQDPVLSGGRLFVTTSGNGGGVFGLDGGTGAVLWRFGAVLDGQWSQPVTGSGMVFVAGNGSVYALDERSGSLRWQYRLPRDSRAWAGTAGLRLLAVGSFLYVAVGGGPTGQKVLQEEHHPALLVLSSESGERVWVSRLPSPAATPVVYGQNSYFYGGTNGRIYALGPLQVRVGEHAVRFEGAWPFMEEGRLLVPVRPVLQAAGATLHWEPESRRVVVTLGDRVINIMLTGELVLDAGRRLPLNPPPRLTEGRLVAPLRPVAEALGLRVHWDQPEVTTYLMAETESQAWGR